MVNGIITELKKFASHDGPGIRTTVFLKGCPLRCKWCSNPETINSYPELYFIPKRCRHCGTCLRICQRGAISSCGDTIEIDRSRCNLCMRCVEECPYSAFRQVGTWTTTDRVMHEIEKDLPFYGDEGGMTLSGGEPLSQPEFSIALLRSCQAAGISTVLDTSGMASPDIVRTAMNDTDMVLLDIKHMDPEQHQQGTGADNQRILENAAIMASHTTVRISLPLIPDFNDSLENISETSKFARSLGIEYIDVNPLHKLGTDKYRCLGISPPYDSFETVDRNHLQSIISLIHSYGLKTTIGRMM